MAARVSESSIRGKLGCSLHTRMSHLYTMTPKHQLGARSPKKRAIFSGDSHLSGNCSVAYGSECGSANTRPPCAHLQQVLTNDVDLTRAVVAVINSYGGLSYASEKKSSNGRVGGSVPVAFTLCGKQDIRVLVLKKNNCSSYSVWSYTRS